MLIVKPDITLLPISLKGNKTPVENQGNAYKMHAVENQALKLKQTTLAFCLGHMKKN